MNMTKILLIVVCCLSYPLSAHAQDSTRAVYGQPTNTTELSLKNQLETSEAVASVVTFINDYFSLPEQLVFFFGGEDGPLYDSAESRVFIPYSFVAEVKNRFIQAQYNQTGVTAHAATNDALMHTMFHELAHAIIFTYQIPVVGKEEDAADTLAAFLLIEFFEDGQEIALSAADIFDLESNDRKVLADEDFWDEHSLDEQRYYSTLCHVYGSDSQQYASLINEEHLSQERAELCIQEYEDISRSWLTLLQPHMRQGKLD